ncbi:sugar transferase [Desulfurobacterium thermolithotrophum]|uniref:sugar transferase n=1 Tax=Desulfurobacterium thermolithotrophum TaxID=64160 RepID=UPI0013D2B9A1|nr:sugar transferase [Desulfurobacterium thermolithotrophum]
MSVENKIPWWKRPFDIVFSLFAILVTLPVMIPIAIIIKVTDRGSVFFKQERPGLNGKKFFVYKFRTMYPDNEKILEEYLEKNPEAKREWELYRKLKTYDPRVTPIGRFLRKYSLDELPQFFNVLKGDMSVVGPRPYICKEFDEYKIPESVRKKLLSVKPGVTGLWQVEGRNEATFEDRVKLDLKYVENLSFWGDIKIILKTIWVMLTGKGAY